MEKNPAFVYYIGKRRKMKQKIVYIAGFRQHAGKTTTSIGMIYSLSKIFSPDDIGYIKPVGQETVEIENGKKIDKDAAVIKKFCLPNLDLQYVSPVQIASGVTKQYLTAKNKKAITKEYARSIYESVARMHDKKIIIAEGTGHPGVGSLIGLSNADVSKMLKAPVLYLAGGGLGKSLDMLTPDLNYFTTNKAEVRGVIFNKLFPQKLDEMKEYLSEKNIAEIYHRRKPLSVLGYFPEDDILNRPSMALLLRKFSEAYFKGDITAKAWEKPSRSIKIITLPYQILEPQEYLNSGDIVILNASSTRRLKKILDYNETLENKIGGIILSCSGKQKQSVIEEKADLLLKHGLPFFFVPQITSEIGEIVTKAGENTKIQIYDDDKIEKVKVMFDRYFDTEKFRRIYGI